MPERTDLERMLFSRMSPEEKEAFGINLSPEKQQEVDLINKQLAGLRKKRVEKEQGKKGEAQSNIPTEAQRKTTAVQITQAMKSGDPNWEKAYHRFLKEDPGARAYMDSLITRAGGKVPGSGSPKETRFQKPIGSSPEATGGGGEQEEQQQLTNEMLSTGVPSPAEAIPRALEAVKTTPEELERQANLSPVEKLGSVFGVGGAVAHASEPPGDETSEKPTSVPEKIKYSEIPVDEFIQRIKLAKKRRDPEYDTLFKRFRALYSGTKNWTKLREALKD